MGDTSNQRTFATLAKLFGWRIEGDDRRFTRARVAHIRIATRKLLTMSTRLSTPEASEYLSLPESTLRYYRCISKGPASYVMGRRVFYDLCDLDAWKDAQKAATLRGGAE
jgi:hypothetical protein